MAEALGNPGNPNGADGRTDSQNAERALRLKPKAESEMLRLFPLCILGAST